LIGILKIRAQRREEWSNPGEKTFKGGWGKKKVFQENRRKYIRGTGLCEGELARRLKLVP